MKKAIAMLLAGVMTLSLTACSGNTASETNSGTGEIIRQEVLRRYRKALLRREAKAVKRKMVR